MLRSVVVAAVALSSAAALAHHSRAAYDMTREVMLEGTVVELAWKNPHIFMTVETEQRARIEVEVTSVSEARALGLPREALEPGARVIVRAHPGRSVPLRKAVGLDLRTSAGAVYPLNTDARVALTPPAVAAESIEGRWAPTLESFNGLVAATRAWPLTDAARAAAVANTSVVVAALGICEPFPPPILSIFPDLRTIEVSETTVVMRFEGAVGVEMERVVQLGSERHPDDLVPSLMGHSIGRWESATLTIDTVGFTPHRVGGLFFPSAAGKRLIERLSLTEDGTALDYTFTLEDSTILAEPVSYTARWSHRPDLEFSGEPCDPAVAERPLSE